MDPIDILGARRGIVCAVGAGGKKTTLSRIAALHPGRVALTASVFAVPPSRRLVDARVFESEARLEEAVLSAVREHRRVAYAHPCDKPGRKAGVSSEHITWLHQAGGFDVTLVKADGARMRGIKAPGEGEPQIVDDTTTVLHISSAAVLGQPLDERVAHRPERLAALLGINTGAVITPAHLARVLMSPEGAWQAVAGARLIPVINQVDSEVRLPAAREAAERALAGCPQLDAVVLAAMRRTDPIVDVVYR